MAENVDFTIVSAVSPSTPRALPWAGRHRGRSAVKAYYRRLAGIQTNTIDDEARGVADQDTVVRFSTLHAHSVATGRSGSWEFAARFAFVDGLIGSLFFYEDSFSAVVLHGRERP